MCTNMFVWLLKILCQTCIAFDQNKIIYDKKKILFHFRRGLKALFFLVPLFGIQLFFVIYRPPAEKTYRFVYEIMSKFIVDSQVV
jgi:hypothetical protein